MATFEITIEEITVTPHPNADRLELAQVGLYNTVVPKGQWVTGDKAFYIPAYSVLPEDLIVFLGLEGRLAGSQHNKVKPLMLRGVLSQGLVAPLHLVPEEVLKEKGEQGNYAEELNIHKWEPVVPDELLGQATANLEIVPWIEIEDLKKFPHLFEPGEQVILTEKIHGVCSCYTFLNPLESDEVLVASKGLSQKGLALDKTETSVYWKPVEKHNLKGLAELVAKRFPGTVTKVAVFGETFGSVQDLKYGCTNGNNGFAVFDIQVTYVGEKTETVWLNHEDVAALTTEVNIPTPPVLYTGPFDLTVVATLASGKEQVSGKELHIREGVVIRPVVAQVKLTGSPKIAKYVSPEYLTRKNGTEFS